MTLETSAILEVWSDLLLIFRRKINPTPTIKCTAYTKTPQGLALFQVTIANCPSNSSQIVCVCVVGVLFFFPKVYSVVFLLKPHLSILKGNKCVETARSWNRGVFSDENTDFAVAKSRVQRTQPRVKKQERGLTYHFM